MANHVLFLAKDSILDLHFFSDNDWGVLRVISVLPMAIKDDNFDLNLGYSILTNPNGEEIS